MIKMIAAVSWNGIIGIDGKIPWHYKTDMKHFKESTTGSTVIMGRRTFESMNKALPNRRNIVISSRPIEAEGVETFSSIEAALAATKDVCIAVGKLSAEADVWFIGGARIYEAGLAYADEIHLTLTPDVIEGENPIRFPWISPQQFHAPMYIELKELVPGDPTLKLAIYKRVGSMEY